MKDPTLELDPEVLADLQLRKSSEHDRSRTRGAGVYDWQSPAYIGKWLCRKCGTLVPITQEAADAFRFWCSVLERRGEQTLDVTKIAVCESCLVKAREARPAKLRQRVDMVSAMIRELKADSAPTPQREREICELLRIDGHPDLDGLMTCIADKRKAQGGRSRGRSGL